MIDGWDNGHSEHYVAMFAIYPDELWNQKAVLLAAAPLLEPSIQTAEEHVVFIRSTLACYQKTTDSILFLIGDNTNLNPAIADMFRVPHLGCASHRLNLGVKA